MACDVISNCFNHTECWKCKWNQNKSSFCVNEDHYKPIDRSIKHPEKEAERLAKKEQEKADKLAAKKTAEYKRRSKTVKNAEKTEQLVVKSLNSGRKNRDADIHANNLVIDVKNQSKNLHPVINTHEFYKVQQDCKNAGKEHGVLCLVNCDGEKFYVITEKLFKEIIK